MHHLDSEPLPDLKLIKSAKNAELIKNWKFREMEGYAKLMKKT